MDEYDQYMQRAQVIREENSELLDAFVCWLQDKGLSQKTINRHWSNIEFFINEFLLYDDVEQAREGPCRIGEFLGDWFIRKAMWANETNIRSNAASLKKFYDFMLERGQVSKDDVLFLRSAIKNDLPEWIATLKRYDDPDLDSEDVWLL